MSTLTAVDILTIHHRRLLCCRAQERVIRSSLFEKAWEAATTLQRSEACDIISKIDSVALSNWVSKIVFSTLDRYSMKILRKLASYHRIKNYSRIDKTKLIAILKEKGIRHAN